MEATDVKRRSTDQFNTEVVEESLYMMGEARDWLVRKERAFQDLLDALEEGRVSFVAARLAVCLDFSEGHKNINEWEERFAGTAKRADYPYLNETLKFPAFRVVLPMRTPREPA